MKQVILLRSDLDGLTVEAENHFIDLATRYYEGFSVTYKYVPIEVFLPIGLVISLDNRMSHLYQHLPQVKVNRRDFSITRNHEFNTTVDEFWFKLKNFDKEEKVTIWDTDTFTGGTISLMSKILRDIGFAKIETNITVRRDPAIHHEILDIRDFFVYKDSMNQWSGGVNVMRLGKRDRIPYWALGKDEGCKATSLRPDQWNRFVADCIHMNQMFGRGNE